MTELSDTEFILQTAQAVVAEVAPEELVSFPLIAEAYVLNPESLQISKASGEVEMGIGAGEVEMGIGAGELIATWTPTILLLLQQAVVQGGKDAAKETAKGMFIGVFGRVSKLWKKQDKKQVVTLPPRGQDLSREELQTLRTFFYETALEYGVKDAKAQQIATCAVGKWATRQVSAGGQQ